MRDAKEFLVRFFWEEAYGTLLASVIALLISLFFANFERIYPLYDPTATATTNTGHPGIMGVFQILQWPAAASTLASLLTSSVRLVLALLNRQHRRGGKTPGTSTL
jgi:hypothetical protein